MPSLFLKGVLETIYMTLASTAIAYGFGLPMGIILECTKAKGLLENLWVHKILSALINIFRSVPFIILLMLVQPLTRLITKTTIGSTATIVPLSIAAIPFIARLVQSSLQEVDQGVIEAATSMGATPKLIITQVLLVEARPSLLTNAVIALTTVLGYTAMAGFVGAGGLGSIAVNYGYYRSNYPMMLMAVGLLIIVVQVFQEVGLKIAHHLNRKKQ